MPEHLEKIEPQAGCGLVGISGRMWVGWGRVGWHAKNMLPYGRYVFDL